MTILRRPVDAAEPSGLLGLLLREELAFRCLRANLAARAEAGRPAGEWGTLPGFPEPGRNPIPSQA